MSRSAKSWGEKYDAANAKGYQLKVLTKDAFGMKAGQNMLIATPKMVEAIIANIPEGHIEDTGFVREQLAKDVGADITCPVTTGIFIRMVSEVANEDFQQGANFSDLVPFWRVLGEKAPLRKKLSFDLEPYLTQQAFEVSRV